MAAPLVCDELWALAAPLLPPEPAKPKGGRPRVAGRARLTGLLFGLKSGIPRAMLPAEMGRGAGMTRWRRLKEGQQAGVWDRLHRVLLARLGAAEAIDWSRAAVDGAAVPAKRGPPRSARTRPPAASRGPSATSWSTGGARPWPHA